MIGLSHCEGCSALCIREFLKLSFRVSMETGAQASAGEAKWDQCSADYGGLSLCELCAH